MPNTPKLPEDVEKRFDKDFVGIGLLSTEKGQFCPHALLRDVPAGKIKQFLAQELATLKAQVRKEIEEQAPEDWMSYDEKNGYDIAITDCLSIPSLKGEE